MHSRNKSLIHTFTLTLYSPSVMKHPHFCCWWCSLYEIIHSNIKPLSIFLHSNHWTSSSVHGKLQPFRQLSHKSCLLLLYEKVLLPLLEEHDTSCFTALTPGLNLDMPSHLDWTWTYPSIHNTFRHKVSNCHFTVMFCWQCTMWVWHAWGKGTGHHHSLPPPLHLNLPHSPPKPTEVLEIIRLTMFCHGNCLLLNTIINNHLYDMFQPFRRSSSILSNDILQNYLPISSWVSFLVSFC